MTDRVVPAQMSQSTLSGRDLPDSSSQAVMGLGMLSNGFPQLYLYCSATPPGKVHYDGFGNSWLAVLTNLKPVVHRCHSFLGTVLQQRHVVVCHQDLPFQIRLSRAVPFLRRVGPARSASNR